MRYLESSVRIFLPDPEVFDSHGAFQVFSFSHVCVSAVVVNTPLADEGILENV